MKTLRPQTKPFTVDRKKSRKVPSQHQTQLGFLAVKSATFGPTGPSPVVPLADRIFGTIGLTLRSQLPIESSGPSR